MKVHFFERKTQENQISIEKLFGYIKNEILKLEKDVQCESFVNPYPLKDFYKSLFYFKKNQGDINHVTGDIHWITLILDSRKTVLTIHDLVGLKNYKGIKKRLYFLFWIYLPIRKLKYITVISERIKREVVSLVPSAEKKIRVIPNCLTINLEEHNDLPVNDKPVLMVIGSTKNKNIGSVIRAIVDLNLQLVIVGNLSKKKHKFLVDNNIDFINKEGVSESELITLYKKTDILCFPSLYEGFGLPILEAQAQNCAVITSNKSPMREIAGDAAILVNPKSEEEIRNAVIKLINDVDLKKELIRNGKENVKKYLPNIIASKYFELYEEILEKY